MSNRNTGDRNTGSLNTGSLNTGNWNTGDRNTGHWNTGSLNTGHWNTGSLNTGHWNTGSLNTGDLNTGSLNTGDLNTGDLNTGNWNTGDLNTGNWNTGNWNTGYFCENDGPVMFFDLPCALTRDEAVSLIPRVDLPIGAEWVPHDKMTAAELAANPNADTLGGYLKKRVLPINEAFPLVWAKMDQATKDRFTSMPNFDADKFLRITGVDVRTQAEPAKESEVVRDRITVNGVEYYLVPVA